MNNFWDTDFKSFILQLFHIHPVYKRLSVCFGESFSLPFFSTIRQRVRESAKLKRETEKQKAKEVYFPFSPPLPMGFVSGRTPDSGCPVVRHVTSGNYHTQ